MTAFARLVLWCFRHAREPEALIEHVGEWLGVLREARLAPRGTDAMRLIWRYILGVQERSQANDVVERLLQLVGEQEKEEIVTVADQLIEQGREQGREQGLREGHRAGEQDGQRKALLKLLKGWFGALPQSILERVNGADLARLDLWFDRVLTAATLDEALPDA